MPPFGNSDKSRKFTYSYQHISQTVHLLMDALGVGRFSLIGHSMGGQIALNMMLQKPEKIDKGILLASSSYYKRARKHHIAASYLPFFSLFVKYYLGKTGVTGNLKSVVYDQSLIDGEMIRGYEEPFEDRRIFSALAHMIRDREGDLPSGSLRLIRTPCLLIWGEHDRIVPVEIGERLANDLPNSKLVVLKNAGHLTPEEKPEEVYKHIKTFICDDRL
jgi:pimeloyl-ACP methyl ester carboxylesterase